MGISSRKRRSFFDKSTNFRPRNRFHQKTSFKGNTGGKKERGKGVGSLGGKKERHRGERGKGSREPRGKEGETKGRKGEGEEG